MEILVIAAIALVVGGYIYKKRKDRAANPPTGNFGGGDRDGIDVKQER